MTTRIGMTGSWKVKHLDADGNFIKDLPGCTNHWTRRGCIEMVERFHSASVAIDPLGGRTQNLFLGSFAPRFALVAKDPLPVYNRADRLGWYRSVGDGKRTRNFDWLCVGPNTSWGPHFTHLFGPGGGGNPPDDVHGRMHRKKQNSEDREINTADIILNLDDKQTSGRFTQARRSLADYNKSYGPSLWHNHGGFPSSGTPNNPGIYPDPYIGLGLGDIWVPLALGKWSDFPGHEIEGGAGDWVDIFYTLDFNISFV